MAKVFISATSDDLAPARALVKQGLLTINLEVVEQTDFEVDYGTMLPRLRRKIDRCDAMVHIAGFRYGGEPEPNALPPDTPRRSYTQWEYHLAKEIAAKREKKGKRFPIYVLVTGVDFPAEPIAPNKLEDDNKRQLQLAHRALLNPEKNTIATMEQLEKRSREVQVELEALRDALARARRAALLWQITAMSVALPVLVIALGGGLADYGCKVPGMHGLCKQYGWGGLKSFKDEQLELEAAKAHELREVEISRQFLAAKTCEELDAFIKEYSAHSLAQKARDSRNRKEKVTIGSCKWHILPLNAKDIQIATNSPVKARAQCEKLRSDFTRKPISIEPRWREDILGCNVIFTIEKELFECEQEPRLEACDE